MYCIKCGKKIDYVAPVCNECLAKEKTEAEASVAEPDIASKPEVNEKQMGGEVFAEEYRAPVYAPAVKPQNPRMIGFGRALTSTILGTIGWIFAYVALIVCTMAATEYGYEGAGVVLSMIATGLSIPSLILGIKSVTEFKRAKSAGMPKPIPTLILGICGIIYAAMSFFFLTISFAMLALI